MEWDFASMQRLIGQRIEAVALKELRPPEDRPGTDRDLFSSRLLFSLEDGHSLEFMIDGATYSHHLPYKVSLLDIRHYLEQDGNEPVVEVAEDKDQPSGVRLAVYDPEVK